MQNNVVIALDPRADVFHRSRRAAMRQLFDFSMAARWSCISALVLLCVSSIPTAAQRAATTSAPMTVESQQTVVSQYCAGCHHDKVKSGGFSWAALDLADQDT